LTRDSVFFNSWPRDQVLNGAAANWCVQCGVKLPFAAHFCPACGRRSVAVPPVTHAVGAPAPPDQVSRSIIAFAFALSRSPSVFVCVIRNISSSKTVLDFTTQSTFQAPSRSATPCKPVLSRAAPAVLLEPSDALSPSQMAVKAPSLRPSPRQESTRQVSSI